MPISTALNITACLLYLLQMNKEFSEVQGTSFQDNLRDSLKNNIRLEFDVDQEIANCDNFVKVHACTMGI